jgi:C-terminal processing protease CtpA/Prc
LISGSPAEDCGSLLIGDRILEVNGVDVRQANIDETATLMANSVGTLQLLVAHRRRASPSVSDDSVVSSVPSLKRKERVYEELLCPTGFTIGSGKCIIIKKLPEESFGINISGGTELGLPIFISHINSDSVMPSTVQRGDIIVSINSLNLTDKTHEEAVQIIKSFTNHTLIKMELVQGDDTYTENGHLSLEWTSWMEKYINRRKSPLEYSVVLKRRGSDRLGFSIVGGAGSYKGDSPIYIKSVATNSIAFNDGRLQCGDQITSINGVPLHNKTSDEVVSIISQSYGDISINIVPLESNE